MEKDRKFRALAIAAICIAVVGVSVAYAALTASLTITGTATVEAATWDVHWDASPSGSANQSTASVSNVAATTDKLTFAVKFTAPGDSVTINAKMVNDGTLKAKLSGNADLTNDNADLAQYIDATMTVDGISYTAAQGKVLKTNGDFVDVVITLTLNDAKATAAWDTISALENKTVTYTADFGFVQAKDADVDYFN